MCKKVIYGLLPLGVMGLIFFFSSQPYEQQDLRPTMNLYMNLDFIKPVLSLIEFTYYGETINIESRGVDGMLEFLIRKAAHLTVFFFLMITTFLAFHHNTGWGLKGKLIVSYMITVLYACFDEYHQSLTPNRTPYAGDVVLDSIGGLVGVLLILLFYVRKSTEKR